MKLLYSITIVLGALGGWAQSNDFKIGMFTVVAKSHIVDGCKVPYVNPKDANGHNTSNLNVLAEDGFNIVQTYEPNEWTSKQSLKNLILLSDANGMKILVGAKEYFLPNIDDGQALGHGSNIYDNCGESIGECKKPFYENQFRPNYNEYLEEVFTQAPYKDFIWGYHVAEEASKAHPIHKENNCLGNSGWEQSNKSIPPVYSVGNFIKCEIPPANVSDALEYFKVNTVGLNHKMVVMEAHHASSIWNGTDDREGYEDANGVWQTYENQPVDYDPQQYVMLLNKYDQRDVFFEGSYYQFPSYWISQDYKNIMTKSETHYLAAFKTIDYSKAFSSQVHEVLGTYYTESSGHTGHYHSSLSIPNANYLWFKAYTSIIHGVKGIWMWDFNTWSPLDHENRASFEDNTNPARFDRQNFPLYYKTYISHLAKELRLLVNQGLISTDPNSVVYTKTDHADDNCIVPNAASYIPSSMPMEKRNENYGLRYTIRTNGEDVIMIVSNPLNIPVSVDLDFSDLGNEIISHSEGVEVLFSTNGYASQENYKVNRESNINLSQNTTGNSYTMNFTDGQQLTLAFGPLDVHVLKFTSSPLHINNNGWEKVYTNHGSGMLSGWGIGELDHQLVGDFTGTGAEELFCIQAKGHNYNWAAMLDYNNASWRWVWGNNGNNIIGDWSVRSDDNFLNGDFDGDGKDELLCIQGWGNSANYVTLFDFVNGNWQETWSNDGDNWLDSWSVRQDDKYIVGDFDGNGTDELLCIQGWGNTGNYASMYNFNNGSWRQMWTNAGNNFIGSWGVRKMDRFRVGDFENISKDQLLCIQGDGNWSTLFTFSNNNWGGVWGTYGSNTFGGWASPVPLTDQILAGDIDANDGKSEVMFIQTGSSASWATSMDFKADQSGWNWNWTANPSASSPYIYDWPIGNDGGSNTKYLLIQAEAGQPKYLLAMRKYGCVGKDFGYLASMYRARINQNMRIASPGSLNNTQVAFHEEYSLSEKTPNNITHGVKIYPNPTENIIYIDYLGKLDDARIEVYSGTGVLLKIVRDLNRQNTIDIGHYPSGAYVITLRSLEGLVERKIILKK